MAVKRIDRRGRRVWILDFRYLNSDGQKARYRRDALIQNRAGAEAELTRRKGNVERYGSPEAPEEEKPDAARRVAFQEAVRRYREGDLRRLKGSTRETYQEVINNLLLPHLGAFSLAELTRAHLVRMDAEIAEAGLSNARRAKALCVLSCILNSAKEDGLLEKLPTFPAPPKPNKNTIQVPSRTEVSDILKSCSKAAHLAFQLALFTGLRTGELRALRWTDLDLKQKKLVVRRSISRGYVDTPKSGHERVIPLHEVLLAPLQSAMAGRRSPWQEVCLSGRAKPWGETGLNQAFQRACQKAGIGGYTFHCCRHYFITELFRAGVGAITVKQLAGHADLKTTQRYAHFVREDGEEAIARLWVTTG